MAEMNATEKKAALALACSLTTWIIDTGRALLSTGPVSAAIDAAEDIIEAIDNLPEHEG